MSTHTTTFTPEEIEAQPNAVIRVLERAKERSASGHVLGIDIWFVGEITSTVFYAAMGKKESIDLLSRGTGIPLAADDISREFALEVVDWLIENEPNAKGLDWVQGARRRFVTGTFGKNPPWVTAEIERRRDVELREFAQRIAPDADLGLSVGEGSLMLAIAEVARATIDDVYADCGDSDSGVLSSNIGTQLARRVAQALDSRSERS